MTAKKYVIICQDSERHDDDTNRWRKCLEYVAVDIHDDEYRCGWSGGADTLEAAERECQIFAPGWHGGPYEPATEAEAREYAKKRGYRVVEDGRYLRVPR